MRQKWILPVIIYLLFPAIIHAELTERIYDKNNVNITVFLENEVNIFAGTELKFRIEIPEGTIFTGLMIYENVKIYANDNTEKKSLPISGPALYESSVTLKPDRYGDLKIQDMEFKFRNRKGNFDITVETLRINVTSMLDNQSSLMDLSILDFKEKKNFLIVIIIITAVLVITAVSLLFIMKKQKKNKNNPGIEFWKKWENLHKKRENKKEFYIMLTNSIKDYASWLSGKNMKSCPHKEFINWIFYRIKISNQLKHDFVKSYEEWEKIKFKKNHISDVYWRDDLKMIKNIFSKLELFFQEKKS